MPTHSHHHGSDMQHHHHHSHHGGHHKSSRRRSRFAGLTYVNYALLALALRKKKKVLTTSLLVIFSTIAAISLFAFKSLVDVAHNMNETASYSEIEMSVVVPKKQYCNRRY